MNLRIAFHTPLPEAARTDVFDLNPRIVKVEVTTQLPGGFETAILTLNPQAGYDRIPNFPLYADLIPRGHVTLEIGQFTVFEGALTKIVEESGGIVEATITGYSIVGLNDDWYRNNEVNVSSSVSQIQSTQKKAGAIIRDAVTSAAPLIQVAQDKDLFEEPGTIYIPGSFYGQTPAQILETVTKVGDAVNLVWDFWVYEDRILELHPRLLKEGKDPDYVLPFDKTTKVTSDFNTLLGQARVEYQLPDWDTVDRQVLIPDHNGNFQTEDKVNPKFQEIYGIMKRGYVKGGVLTAGVANQLRDTLLTVNQFPTTSGIITRNKWRGFELASGGEMPTYSVRSGQWVKVGDKNPLVIVRTKWNNTGDFEAEIGKSTQHWMAFLSYLDEVSRHVVMGTNPLSGARS